MRRSPLKRNSSGSIMIVVLWSLALLTLLAASLGLGMRQKITLLSRLEDRTKIRLLAESGVKKAITLLNRDLKDSRFLFSAPAKMFRHNNMHYFQHISLKEGNVSVGYILWDGQGFQKEQRWGVVDEESKLNLNHVQVPELIRLIQVLFDWDDAKASEAARAIVDWREYGESEIKGFYSDEQYGEGDHSYKAKNEDYEMLDELLLVKGLDEDSALKLFPYLTVYGSGRVNINTASRPVLIGLGLDDELADKILLARRGRDAVEATSDDFIFLRTFDIASELSGMVKLNSAEIAQIDRLNQDNRLDVNSLLYSIHAEVNRQGKSDFAISAVFDGKEGRILYWKEEY